MLRSPHGLALLLLACGGSGDSAGPEDTSPFVPQTTWVVDEAYPPGAPAVDWFEEVVDPFAEVFHVVDTTDPKAQLAGAGMAAGDLDGDGVDDLVLAPGDAPARVFRGLGDLRWDEISDPGLGPTPASSAALADLDLDGHLDLILGRDELVVEPGPEPMLRLLWGSGDGTFSEDPEAGITAGAQVKSLLLRDLDGDGLQDVYAGLFAVSAAAGEGAADGWFRNRGDRRFEALPLGPEVAGFTWANLAFDAEGDGRRTLFLGHDNFVEDNGDRPLDNPDWADVPDQLLEEGEVGPDGLPTFEARPDAAVSELRATMNAIAADFDGDARLDLFLSDFGRNELLLRQPDGSYLDATDAWGVGAMSRDDSRCPPDGLDLRCLLVSWGSAFADLDLDGHRDLIVLHGQLGLGDGRQPVAAWRGAEGALEPVQVDLPWMDARALLAHDLDGDGDLDLLLSTFGGPFRVFENTVDAPGFARARFVGTTSAHDGSGTRVRVTLDGRTEVVELGTGGTAYTVPETALHLGLGSADEAQLEWTWPTGLTQSATVAAGSRTTFEEPLLVELSRRVAPADGATTVDVSVYPREADGSLSGPGRTVSIEADEATWTGPVVDLGDGRYQRTMVAPTEPALVPVEVHIDGAEPRLRPRVRFDAQ